MRGRRANDLRELGATARLRPGIYGLVVHEGVGLVVPVRPRSGAPRPESTELAAACEAANRTARAWLRTPSLPSLRLELEEFLAVVGASLGLPAALAYIAYYGLAAGPERAVLASGRLGSQGEVLPVSYLEAKLAAARAEVGDAVILVPSEAGATDGEASVIRVRTIAEAVARSLGPVTGLDPTKVAVEAVIARARADPEHAHAIAALEALAAGRLSKADRLKVDLELGTRLRHAGRTQEAFAAHARARSELDSERRVVGAESAERFELEFWLTAMDQFRLNDTIPALSRRLDEPFLNLLNELRCRGMLAQALAMSGKPAEAVEVREGNLPLHEQSDELARILPGTLCFLVLDSARASDAWAFERYAERLLETTDPGQLTQVRYNSVALVRGLVALGRDRQATDWAEGACSLFGCRAAPAFVDDVRSMRAEYPLSSALRALCRAYRRTGRAEQALRFGARASAAPSDTDLSAWVERLIDFEIALAEQALGRDGNERLERARAALPALHEAATRYHAGLLSSAIADLEREIDRVHY